MEYSWTDDMRTVTGEDPADGYEQACKKMVIAGAEWLAANPTANINLGNGEINEDSDDFKSLKNMVACAVSGYGISGAQHSMAMGHILAIKRLGWEGYCEEMRRMKRDEQDDGN